MKTSRVTNIEEHWGEPPPARSPRCAEWLSKIEAGWCPNRRLRQMDYYSAAEFFGVWIWEYLYEVSNALRGEALGDHGFETKPVPPFALTVTSAQGGRVGQAIDRIKADLLRHGNACFELVRTDDGVVSGLNHLPWAGTPAPPPAKHVAVRNVVPMGVPRWVSVSTESTPVAADIPSSS